MLSEIRVLADSEVGLLAGDILVIDDDMNIREALTDVFGVLTDATVYTAANGHEALQILQQYESIALVLLDMNMPVMNGEETYERLQQIAPAVRVIVSSSLSPDEARFRFGERELPVFLQKPYDVNKLLDVMQSLTAMDL